MALTFSFRNFKKEIPKCYQEIFFDGYAVNCSATLMFIRNFIIETHSIQEAGI
jgi:hypothetical protein